MPKQPLQPTPKDTVEVLQLLLREFPDPRTELKYDNPFQLLVAVILSAQCTDKRVNETTPELFKRYPSSEKMKSAPIEELERIIHSCGFYRNKAKAIREMAKVVSEKWGGKVPNSLDDLVSLPGVGRKTASVVLNQAFDTPAIAVDTHVNRVSHRLGWSHSKDPIKVEQELMRLVPKDNWAKINGLLILHGRKTCKARRPLCEECNITRYCNYYALNVEAHSKPA